MASCVRNTYTKNYQNLVIGFQVTVENVGNVFVRHSVYYALGSLELPCAYFGEILNTLCVKVVTLRQTRFNLPG